MKYSKRTKLDELAYQRDGYKCRDCGKSERFNAHHIIDGIEELDNLISLCYRCHKQRHNMIGCFKNGKDLRRKIFNDEERSELGRNSSNQFKVGHPFYGNQFSKR